MSKTISELLSQASSIKRATSPGANTAAIVGGLFEDIINYLANINSTPATETVNGQSLRDYVVSEINRLTDRDNQLEDSIWENINTLSNLLDSINYNPENRWLQVKDNSVQIPEAGSGSSTPAQVSPDIFFTEHSLYVTNASSTGLKLWKPSDVTVEFSSSNPSVATVDSDGQLTIHLTEGESGNTTITATSIASAKYYSQTTSYNLYVNIPATQPEPEEPQNNDTEVTTLEDGKYYYYKGTVEDVVNPIFCLIGPEIGIAYNSSYNGYWVYEDGSTPGFVALGEDVTEERSFAIFNAIAAIAPSYGYDDDFIMANEPLKSENIVISGYILPQNSGSGSGSGGSSLNPNSKLEISENLSSADSGYYYIKDYNNFIVYLNFDACVVYIPTTSSGNLVKYNALTGKLTSTDTVANPTTVSTLSSSVASYISSHGKNMASGGTGDVLSSEQMWNNSPKGYLEINS